MKNNNDIEIKQARENKYHKAASTDMLAMPAVVKSTQQRLINQSKRKRHRNYLKKIMNDPFIMNL